MMELQYTMVVFLVVANQAFSTTLLQSAGETVLADADAVVEASVVGFRETVSGEGLPIVYYDLQVLDVLKELLISETTL